MNINVTSSNEVSRLARQGYKPCLVCGGWRRTYTDYHCEVYCLDCGMIYQVGNIKPSMKWLVKHGIQECDVKYPWCKKLDTLEMYRAYWNDTGNRAILGSFFGRSPYSRYEHVSYITWLHDNRHRMSDDIQGSIKWDVVEKYLSDHKSA